MSEHPHTNRLITASSPYLQQHAHNPVDWWEWCDEAFEKAEKEEKLVLVSIGYSACHWCHVMEHECFEKEDTAAIMNAHFVCIKVDREERPDVDQIYMDAVQLLTGRGGWPLNCFTLPDRRPVHGGTYFPKEEWEKVLISLADFYRNKREEVYGYADDLTQGIRKLDIPPAGTTAALISFEELENITETWSHSFDMQLGGFSWAPKFPMPANWEFFLQHGQFSRHKVLTEAFHTTMRKMAEGGIYDQAGGGFARYSTDAFWKVPHFEKMGYDNAQLTGLYAKAYQHKKELLYKNTVAQTHAFIRDELTSPEGLFFSALDADSEGVEGKYYIWTQKELAELLGSDEPLFSLYYSIDAYGNWEHGENILYKTRTDSELENLTGKNIESIREIIEKCNALLLAQRSKRIPPGLDDKVITSWNALMIKGYSEAYEAFGDPAYLAAAEKCAGVLLEKLWNGNQLFRIFKDGKISIHGFAEDYAALSEALIYLYEAGGNEEYLHRANEIMHSAIAQFYDSERKLFFFKSSGDTQLITRKVDVNDDVIPSANSMFAKTLYKLGFFFDAADLMQMADDMLLAVQEKMRKFPNGFSNWMQLLVWKQQGFNQVIICGQDAKKIKQEFHTHYLPGTVVVALEEASDIPLLKDKRPGEATKIYVCRDKTCGLPVSNVKGALQQLGRI